MTEQKIDIYFRGDIAPGEKIMDVRERLKKLFKADDEQMQRLFSGRPAVIRRNLDGPAAEQYSQAMLKAGALVELRPVEPEIETDQASPDSAEIAPENLTDNQQAPASPEPGPAAQSKGDEKSSTKKTEGTAADQSGDFSIAPVGADMLNEEERGEVEVVEVDISALSADAMSGDILGDEEKPKVEVVTVDTSHLSVEDLPPQ
jgi:hypothetical protein